MMEFLEFPKFFRELSAEELGKTLKDIGFDGVDVMVRDAYWVTYDTLKDSLPEYIKTMHSFGLSTKSATTSITDTRDPRFEDMYRIFADNGVEMYRYGGFGYRGMGSFHQSFQNARSVIAELEKLGQKYNIKAILQMHGGTLHCLGTLGRCGGDHGPSRHVGDPGRVGILGEGVCPAFRKYAVAAQNEGIRITGRMAERAPSRLRSRQAALRPQHADSVSRSGSLAVRSRFPRPSHR